MVKPFSGNDSFLENEETPGGELATTATDADSTLDIGTPEEGKPVAETQGRPFDPQDIADFDDWATDQEFS